MRGELGVKTIAVAYSKSKIATKRHKIHKKLPIFVRNKLLYYFKIETIMKFDVCSPGLYRSLGQNTDLVPTHVREGESDLYILASRDFSSAARQPLRYFRRQLKDYLKQHRGFRESLLPVGVGEGAPLIVKHMAEASASCGVGPMAAVAGALAYLVGEELLSLSPEIIVENGGDIFIVSRKKRTIAVYAGKDNPFSGRLGIVIDPRQTPLGVATSSGSVGHSLSWGKAAAAVVVARDPPLADAAATALANRIYSPRDSTWREAIDFMKKIEGIKGGIIIMGEKVSAWGEIELVVIKKY